MIWCANRSTIAIAKNPIHGHSKHIKIKFHFIQGLVADEMISLQHCNTEKKLADIFTKPIPMQKHVFIRSQLRVYDFQSREGVEM